MQGPQKKPDYVKAAKLPLVTILVAFSLGLAGVAPDQGASASERKGQSSPAGQRPMPMLEKSKRLTKAETKGS
jgi:hypothetical protein